MKEIAVHSWAEFEAELVGIREKHASKKLIHNLLFRGHGQSQWRLTTTLERNHQWDIRFIDYYRKISIALPEIEAFTSNKWDIPTPGRVDIDA
ncbi:MAG: hypothetical protein WBQ17_11040, partial [Rhizomicrobium sp.]